MYPFIYFFNHSQLFSFSEYISPCPESYFANIVLYYYKIHKFFYWKFSVNLFVLSWLKKLISNLGTQCHCSSPRKAKDCENCNQQGNNFLEEIRWKWQKVVLHQPCPLNIAHFLFHFWLFHILWCSFVQPYSCNLISIGQFTILGLFWSYCFFIFTHI